MLIKATLKDIDTYGEFVYQLALDQTHSCYPAYSDGIKTKEDFLADAVKGVTGNHSELLLFLPEGAVEGWIRYYWLPEDHYLQLVACNIRSKTAQALSELIELLQKRFSGYTLYFGFPGKNTEAIRFLQAQDFKCVEDDWNYSFFFDRYELQPDDAGIARITRENFDDFRAVYHPEAAAYWNCDRIEETLEDWIIFVSYQKNVPVGTIFLRGNQDYYEIYNVVFAEKKNMFQEEVFQEEVFRALLIAGLNACKRLSAKYLTYLCDIEKAKPVLTECGFQCIGQYVLYLKTLQNEINYQKIDFTTITACGECCVKCSKKISGECPGCIEADGIVPEWKESGRCKIHTCVHENEVQFCGLCKNFPCDNISTLIPWNSNIVEHMAYLRDEYKRQA